MNSSSNVQSNLGTFNRFPSCVSVELEGVPVQRDKQFLNRLITFDLKPSSTENKRLDVLLTIRFGEETIDVPGGKITFGLRRGELKLKLFNCEMPLKSVKLASPFEIHTEASIQKEQEFGREGNASLSVKSSISATVKALDNTTTKFSRKTYKVHSIGSAIEPTWLFQIDDFEKCLRGLLKQEKLGTINLKPSPCCIKLTFKAPNKSSIRLTSAEGLWPSNIDRNKLAIIERKIALLLLEKKLKPYLTHMEMTYE